MFRPEIFVILASFTVLAFQNCGTGIQNGAESYSYAQGKACQAITSCPEGVQFRVLLSGPAPKNLDILIDGKPVLNECSPENQMAFVLRSETNPNLLHVFWPTPIYSVKEVVQFSLSDLGSCTEGQNKKLIQAQFHRDQFELLPEESKPRDIACDAKCPHPTLTIDELDL